MKTIRKMFFALVTCLVATPLMADSGNFAGPYVGIQASVVGVELDGSGRSSTSTGDGITETTTGTIGRMAVIAAVEAGYAIPLGTSFLLDIGASYVDGNAKVGTTNTDTSATADVTFEIKDLITGYIAPTIVLSDTSSAYLKVGLTEADTATTGDVTQPANLSGTTVALGTRTVLTSGFFIRTEAGFTDYNGISVHGKAAGGTGKSIAANRSFEADPTVAFGNVSVGFKF